MSYFSTMLLRNINDNEKTDHIVFLKRTEMIQGLSLLLAQRFSLTDSQTHCLACDPGFASGERQNLSPAKAQQSPHYHFIPREVTSTELQSFSNKLRAGTLQPGSRSFLWHRLLDPPDAWVLELILKICISHSC